MSASDRFGWDELPSPERVGGPATGLTLTLYTAQATIYRTVLIPPWTPLPPDRIQFGGITYERIFGTDYGPMKVQP